jgi:hypothetical protein
LLRLGELLIERLGRVEFKGPSRLGNSHCSRLLAHLFSLQIALQRVQEQAVVGDAIPVENLLLFLGPDAVVFVQEIQKRALGFFERGIGAGFEVAQVGEDSFFEFLRVLDGAAKRLEAKGQTPNDIGTRDMEEVAPCSRLDCCLYMSRLGEDAHQSTQET